MTKTSWNQVSPWYHKLVGTTGHYFHEHVIFPKSLPLLQLNAKSKVLDLACGNGILAHHIPKEIEYIGIDISPNLIAEAKKQDKNPHHRYFCADITQALPISETNFTHAAIILALQNVEKAAEAIKNAAKHLQSNGKFLIVLNHPAFRIPRQSSWGIDEQNKMQYRRINRYLSLLKIPITMHPGKSQQVTWSFHLPISGYSKLLTDNGFVIEKLEEWTSDKESVGAAAKMENLAREEFPLFLTLLCRKK